MIKQIKDNLVEQTLLNQSILELLIEKELFDFVAGIDGFFEWIKTQIQPKAMGKYNQVLDEYKTLEKADTIVFDEDKEIDKLFGEINTKLNNCNFYRVKSQIKFIFDQFIYFSMNF